MLLNHGGSKDLSHVRALKKDGFSKLCMLHKKETCGVGLGYKAFTDWEGFAERVQDFVTSPLYSSWLADPRSLRSFQTYKPKAKAEAKTSQQA